MVANALARAQSVQFGAHIKNIKDFETGEGGVRRDWRASEALLKMKFPQLFQQQPQAVSSSAPTISIQAILAVVARIAPAQVELKEVKALPENSSVEEV